MLEALKTLFENNVISEEIKADIEKAWDSRITENRTQVTQQLREEFTGLVRQENLIQWVYLTISFSMVE